MRAGADVSPVRGETETGYPLGRTAAQGCWCWPGVQTLTVRGCFAVAPVDMLAVEVANILYSTDWGAGTSGWP